MRRVFERGRRGRGVGMIFFMGGPNFFFVGFSRHISDFLVLHAKT